MGSDWFGRLSCVGGNREEGPGRGEKDEPSGGVEEVDLGMDAV